MSGKDVRIGRVYDEPADSDGHRVLVDRLWPRGLTKARARIDDWYRDVAPSPELRRWYHHDPQRFGEFRSRYRRELEVGEQAQALQKLRALAEERVVTLLTATRDPALSQAAVLAELLRGR